MGILAKASVRLPRELLKIAYTGLIRSQLEYASILYLGQSKAQLKRLDVIQKQCVRIVCHKPRNTHSAPLLEELKLDTLGERRKVHATKIVMSALSGVCHPSLANMFKMNDDSNLIVKKAANRQGSKGFHIIGANIFNKVGF
jgi:hypothetical protein